MRTRSSDPDALAYLRLVGVGALIGTSGLGAVPGAVLAAVAAWPTVQALDRRATAGIVVEEAKA